MRQTGKDFSGRRDKILVPRKDGLIQALQTQLTMDHYVLGIPKSTLMQLKSTKSTSKEQKLWNITKINAEELPDFDCLVGGFPFAKHFLSQGYDVASRTLEERSF